MTCTQGLLSKWLFVRYMLTGLYVSAATVGSFVWWYVDKGVSATQLMHWGDCRTWKGFSHSALSPAEGQLTPSIGSWVASALHINTDPIKTTAAAAAAAAAAATTTAARAPAYPAAGAGSACNVFTSGRAGPQALSLSVLVTMELLKAASAISLTQSIFVSPPWKNPALLVGIAVPFLLHLTLLYTPQLAAMFGLCPLSLRDWKVVLAFAVPILLIEELLKWMGRHLEREKQEVDMGV